MVEKSTKNTAYKSNRREINCTKQYPDCPDEVNDSSCKKCPLYKSKF